MGLFHFSHFKVGLSKIMLELEIGSFFLGGFYELVVLISRNLIYWMMFNNWGSL